MPYPTPAEFLSNLQSDGVDAAVERVLSDDVPFAFEGAPDQFEAMRERLSSKLGVAIADITLVGSGRFGFSLDPTRWGIAFSERSDLDIVVVSSHLFHTAWLDLGRNWRKAQLGDSRLHRSVSRHRDDLVFYGRIIPADLPGIIRLSRPWFEVFGGLGGIPLLARRDVRAQLWDCWDHARLYYRNSLAQVRTEPEV
jgi:hypothetical protein